MLIRLAVPFADVRAGDLSLTLDAPAERALEVLAAEAAGFRLELRLLGCSHQALADGGATLSETVACRPGASGSLPALARRRTPHGDYAFAASIRRLPAAAFASQARELIAAAGDDPLGLAGIFPGAPDAFTALRVEAGECGLTWRTWHGYPQSGELVATASRLERRA